MSGSLTGTTPAPATGNMLDELSSIGLPQNALAAMYDQSATGQGGLFQAPQPAQDDMPSVPFQPGLYGNPAPSSATDGIRPPPQVTTTTTSQKSGGGLGGILPMIADAAAVVASPFTGGASLAAIPAISAIGGGLNAATNGKV